MISGTATYLQLRLHRQHRLELLLHLDIEFVDLACYEVIHVLFELDVLEVWVELLRGDVYRNMVSGVEYQDQAYTSTYSQGTLRTQACCLLDIPS